MTELYVSNLQNSRFHSCVWEKEYIIRSSLAINWSSAFSFLHPIFCKREKDFLSHVIKPMSSWSLLKYGWRALVEHTCTHEVGRRAERGRSRCWAGRADGRIELLSQHRGLVEGDPFVMSLRFLEEFMVFQPAGSKPGGWHETRQRTSLPPRAILKSWNFDSTPQLGPSKTPARTRRH